MQKLFVDENLKYDGSQLKSLFAYMNYGLLGDSIVAWQGPCDVAFDQMIDGEDLRAKSRICSDQMVHFIVEQFAMNLPNAIAMQRLLAAIVADQIRKMIETKMSALTVRRDGDDIYIGEGKLSISIATVSQVSALIHFAVNVTNAGTPVKTAALSDLHIEPTAFAKAILDTFSREAISIREATCKVRPAHSY